MITRTTLASLVAAVLICCPVAAQQARDTPAKKEMSIVGEIIDVKCYLTDMGGARGEEHKQCAIDCINGGLPVGILEEKTDNVYVVVPKKGMDGANKSLVKYVAEKVKLTGAIVAKGGARLFVFSKVEEVK